MSLWKRTVRCLVCVLAFVSMIGNMSLAAERPTYKYTVTIAAGNRGKFVDTSGVECPSHAKKSLKRGSMIEITNLEYGDSISIFAQSGMVSVTDSKKYYVKGVRISGRDNNTVGKSSFQVEKDEDYVIAYGIQGKMVSYSVHYEDESGKELAKTETFYGNVGDKPVVAYHYIDGYQPQAYNLTKTLVSDESKNVFTFVYKTSTMTREQQSQQSQTVTETTTETVTERQNGSSSSSNNNNSNNNTSGNNNTSNTSNAGNNAGGTTNAGGTAGGADNGDNGNDTAEQGGEDNGSTNGSDNPQNLVDLDDEDVPLANKKIESQERSKKPMILYVLVGVLAVAALGALAAFLIKRKKENG